MKKFVILICLSAFLFLSLFFGCSSENSTEPKVDDTGTITLDQSEAESMSFIQVNGLPSDIDSLYAIVLPASTVNDTTVAMSLNSEALQTPNATDTGYSLIMNTDSGYYLVSPLNPSDPTGGGLVQILISDGETIFSEPLELLLDSLPEAPGELEAIVSLMQQVLTEQLRIGGYTRDSLDNIDSTNIPLHLIQLAEYYDIVDSPDNPNSLNAIVDGTAPILAELDGDKDLFDRVWAMTGFRDYYEDLLNRLQAVTPATFNTGNVLTIKEATLLAKSSSSICIPAPDFGITDCASLADAMQTVSDLNAAANSAGEKVLADIVGASFFVVGLVPGGKFASVIGGTMLFADAKVTEGQGNLYPSEFVDGVSYFDPDTDEFTEDFTEPGKWTEFTVSARSKGWVLDKAILETILKAISLKKATARWDEPLPSELEGAFKKLDSAVAKTINGKARKLIYKELLGNTDFIEVCANIWEDIDCVDDQYSDVTVSTGQVAIDEVNHTYAPEATGQATFRIETNDAFGNISTGMGHAINTKEIVVHVDPFQADADTVEWLEFNYWVENATNPDVDITLFNGGTILIQDESTVTIETPNAPWVFPLELEVKSKSSSGLRANATDDRIGSSFISYQGAGSAYIYPNFKCIKPGDPPEQFVLRYTGSEIHSVEWSLDPPGIGSLNPSDTIVTFTPPEDPAGQVTLKAVVNDSIDAYATIDISDCRCYWELNGGGSGHAYAATGTWGLANNTGALTVNLSPEENGFRPIAAFVIYGAEEAGTYPVETFYFEGEDEIGWGWQDTTVAKPTVTIEVFEYYDNGSYVAADYIQGYASGTLSRRISLNPLEYEYITFNLENFRAEFFRLERPQCTEDTTGNTEN